MKYIHLLIIEVSKVNRGLIFFNIRGNFPFTFMKIRIAFFIFFRFYFVKDRRVLLYAGVGDLLSRWVLLCSSRPWWRYGGGGGEAGEPAAVGGAGGGGVGAGGGGERLRIPSLLPLAQVRSGVQPAAAHHPRRRQRHRGERRHPPGDGLQQVPPVGGPPRRSCLRLLGLRRALPCRQRDRHQRALLAGERPPCRSLRPWRACSSCSWGGWILSRLLSAEFPSAFP